MKKAFFVAGYVIIACLSSNAQSKIKDGTVTPSPAIPAANAILELESNNKGFIPPRVALTGSTDITTIANPTDGMIAYNTATIADITPGVYYFQSGAWKKLSAEGASIGGNAQVQTTAFVGSYPAQYTNGITFGDFSFRIGRRTDALTYTTSSEQLDVQVKYNGASPNITLTGYASTMFASGQFDYSNQALAAPTANPQTATRNNNILNSGVWYSMGEPGFALLPTAIEKRQYVLTPIDASANYFYRVEFMVADATIDCGACNVGNPSENDAKIIMYIEYVVVP